MKMLLVRCDTVNSEKIALVIFSCFLRLASNSKLKFALKVYSWHSMLRPISKVKKRKNRFSVTQDLLYTIFCESTVCKVLLNGCAILGFPH